LYVIFDYAISHTNTQHQEKRCSSPLLGVQTIAPYEFSFRGSSSIMSITVSQ